jgi:hypothetical protein
MIIKTTEEAVVLLNNMLERDPEGVSRFFMHPGIVKRSVCATSVEGAASPFTEQAFLFPLGFLNGFVCGTDDTGRVTQRIAAQYPANSHIIETFYVEDMTYED